MKMKIFNFLSEIATLQKLITKVSEQIYLGVYFFGKFDNKVLHMDFDN